MGYTIENIVAIAIVAGLIAVVVGIIYSVSRNGVKWPWE